MKITGCWHQFIALLAALAFGAAPAAADEFRIESKVYANNDPKAVRENVTIFHDGIVYDYSSNPQEITILDADPSRARFILLNPARQQKLEIKLSKITELMNDVRKAGLETGEDKPFMKFVFNPSFKQGWDDAKRELVLDSQWMEYRLTTENSVSPAANDQYHQFSDWFAQLNSITSATAMPPFARQQVNGLLHQHRQIPKDVKLTLKGVAPGNKDMVFTSKHIVMWQLLEADIKRIDKTHDMFVKFTAMPPEEYFKEDVPTKGGKPAPPVAEKPKATTQR